MFIDKVRAGIFQEGEKNIHAFIFMWFTVKQQELAIFELPSHIITKWALKQTHAVLQLDLPEPV
jgi:hypothetical protein